MLGIFTGAAANAAMIAAGTAVGLLFKTKLLEKIGSRIFQAFALFVIVMGVGGALDLSNTYLILASLILGPAVGELVDLDGKFTKLGNFLQARFSAEGDSSFAKGFIQSSLMFCVGSMSVVGALQSGLEMDHKLLITKGVLDCVAAVTLTMGFGIGVGFSALMVLLYEGALAACAGLISPVMAPEILAVSSTVGNMFLIGMGLNMLEVTDIRVANFLPGIFVPVVYQAVVLLIA